MTKKVGESQYKILAPIGLTIILVLTAFFVYQIQHVKVDYDFEKFFPMEDSETEYFFEFRDKFESDNDFLLIAIENKSGIYDWQFLEQVKDYETRLKQLEDVVFTQSIVSQEELLVYGGVTAKRPYINFEDRDLKRDQRLIEKNQELSKTFVAENNQSLCIFLRHTDYLGLEKCDELLDNLELAGEPYDFDKVRIAGRVIGQKFYIEKMSFEMALFVSLSFVLVTLFLLVAFKSVWGLLLPLVVLMGSMIWVIGFMGWFGEPISVVMTTLPSIMFVVAMSDVIHLVSRYLDIFRRGYTKFEALRVSINEVGLATFLTSVTTAIGFFSLNFVSVQPLQVFGMISGYGVMIAFGLTFVLLPILIYYLPSPKRISKMSANPFWGKHLSNWFVWMLNHKLAIVIGTSVVLGLSVYGASTIRVNNYLMDELSEEEPMKQDFNFLDANYGGVRPLELSIELTDTALNLWDLSVLNKLEKVEDYLETAYGATIKTSLVKAVKVVNRSTHGGQVSYFRLPEKQRDLSRMRRPLRLAQQGDFYNLLVDSTERVLRVSGTIPDWGSAVSNKRNEAFYAFIDRELKGSGLTFRLTGTAHLFDKNISYLSTSMIKGLSFSVLIVALIMGLLYRSLTMVVISIVPNMIPLLFIAGLMGFMGVELKTSTAIIFTIAFGIAVDDTIHFLGKFKYELMKGRTVMYALKRSFMVTGKAMILTTLVLCAGFMLLMLSSFQGTFMMGMLLCLTLFVALIADLTILPVLLIAFVKNKPNQVEKMNH